MSLKDEIRALVAKTQAKLEDADKQHSDALEKSQAKLREVQPFVEEIQAAGGHYEFSNSSARVDIWVGKFGSYRPYECSIHPPKGLSLDPRAEGQGLVWQVYESIAGDSSICCYFATVEAMFEDIVPKVAEAIAVHEHGKSKI